MRAERIVVITLLAVAALFVVFMAGGLKGRADAEHIANLMGHPEIAKAIKDQP